MAKKLEEYIKIKKAMLEADHKRDENFRGYAAIYHCDWELPAGLTDLQWIRKETSTEGHDAIEAGVRVLTTKKPGIKYQPLSSNPETKTLANEYERNLSWQLESLNRRRQATVEADTVRSAMIYDAVFIQVVDLDWQMKLKEKQGMSAKREKAMRLKSRFLVNTYSPENVHVRWSGYMPEAVLVAVKRKGHEIKAEWPKAPQEIKDDREYDYFDYMDYESRAVWCQEGTTSDKPYVLMLPTDHDLPFLPWALFSGGSTIETKEEEKYHPILYTLLKSGSWETLNVVRTLYTSEVIRYASAPRLKEEGQTAIEQRSTQIDYGDSQAKVDVTPLDTLTQLQPPQIDRALTEIDDRKTGQISQSTVPKVLLNAEFPSGTAFATLNLAIQTGVAALNQAKQLSERALAEMFTIMLLWVEYTQNNLLGYGTEKKKDLGTQYEIEWDTIDPGSIYIDVDLVQDIPTDRQQRVNTASIAVQTLGYPREYALEDIGVQDPQLALKQSIFERYTEALVQNQLQQIQFQTQMLLQQLQQGQPQGTGMPGGMGYNPAMQGLPPAMASPQGGIREQVQGVDRAGIPINQEA